MHTCIHTHTYIQVRVDQLGVRTHIHAYMHTHTHTYMQVRVDQLGGSPRVWLDAWAAVFSLALGLPANLTAQVSK